MDTGYPSLISEPQTAPLESTEETEIFSALSRKVLTNREKSYECLSKTKWINPTWVFEPYERV